MPDAALVSIVIPSYNYERFLRAAIDSALAQSHPAVEVIPVDDGSTDGSRDIIASYGDRVRPVLKANGGHGTAMNAGFAACRGDVVIFLDADDVLLPDAARAAAAALDGGDAAKVHWQMWEVDGDGTRTGALHPPEPPASGDLRARAAAEGPLSDAIVPASGNAYPRWFLDRVMPVQERFISWGGDAWLFTQAPAYGPVATLAEPQGLYRVHGTNAWAAPRPLLDDAVRARDTYRLRADLLRKALAAQGIEADPAEWDRRKGWGPWLDRVAAALEELVEAVPDGERVVLVADEQLGHGRLAGEREALRLLDEGGLPATGADAAAALARRAEECVGFVAFAWPSFWWLESYPELAGWLDERATRTLATEHMRVYALSR